MYTNLTAIIQEDGRIRLSGPCVVTGLEYSVVVSREGALAYFERGVAVREAFPELPKEEREFLISGTSPSGWRKFLGGDEDSEGDPAEQLDVVGGHTDASRESGLPGSSNNK